MKCTKLLSMIFISAVLPAHTYKYGAEVSGMVDIPRSRQTQSDEGESNPLPIPI